MHLVVLVKQSMEALPEDLRRKGVGQNHDTIGEVGE